MPRRRVTPTGGASDRERDSVADQNVEAAIATNYAAPANVTSTAGVAWPVRCGGLHLAPHLGGVQRAAQREDLVEQVGGQPVGDQPGETGLQVGQLRGGPLRRTAPNGLNVRAAVRGVQGQAHQRGLSRRSVPNNVRITMRRLSLCRRGMPQSGHRIWADSAVVT